MAATPTQAPSQSLGSPLTVQSPSPFSLSALGSSPVPASPSPPLTYFHFTSSRTWDTLSSLNFLRSIPWALTRDSFQKFGSDYVTHSSDQTVQKLQILRISTLQDLWVIKFNPQRSLMIFAELCCAFIIRTPRAGPGTKLALMGRMPVEARLENYCPGEYTTHC